MSVSIITGGSRGIGAATARRLSAAGHAVCVGYRAASQDAERIVEEIRSGGRTAIAVQVDTADENSVTRLFDAVRSELGQLTGLVNNAGINSPLSPLASMPVSEIRRVFDVNVIGLLLCTQRAIVEMSTVHGGPGGAIVNLSSAAATLGSPGEYVHYAGSKAAVDAMTVGLSKEVAREGIRVNAVAPGIISTEIHASAGDPDRPSRMADTIPIGRPGEADEVAAAIAWLLSPDASYTTGTILRVAGGR